MNVNNETLMKLLRISQGVHQIAILEDIQRKSFNNERFNVLKEKREIIRDMSFEIYDESVELFHKIQTEKFCTLLNQAVHSVVVS